MAVLQAAKTRELGDQAATKRFQSVVSEAIEYIRQDYTAADNRSPDGPCYPDVSNTRGCDSPLNELKVSLNSAGGNAKRR